jgi:hypothetical protein
MKLPVIGIIIGAVAATFALLKRKKQEPTSQDTNPTP